MSRVVYGAPARRKRDESADICPTHKIGVHVTTDFSGRVTRHVITGRCAVPNSQSGILLRVDPSVPKSSGLNAWIDAAWFTPVDGAGQDSPP
jgi:hypothetical protein